MSLTLDRIKIKMDGQEHEIENAEIDNEGRAIYLDLDDTFSVHVEDIRNLFQKELQIQRIGHDDDFIKAQIDSFYVETDSKDNHVLGLSF